MHFSYTISLGQIAVTLAFSLLSLIVKTACGRLLRILGMKLWEHNVSFVLINKHFPDDIPEYPHLPKKGRPNGAF